MTELVILVAALPVAAVAGGIHGAVTAPSEKEIEEARESLGVALNGLGTQQAMRNSFIAIARQKAEQKIEDINEIMFFAGNGEKLPVDEGELIKANDLKEVGFDSVIIYEATAMRLNASGDGNNPPLSLSIDAKVRILTSDGAILYVTDFACKGEEHRFAEWAAKDCSLFKEALERCYNDIAEQAVERLFIANDIKEDGRFIAYDNGTVLDTQTNLMWAAWDNGYNVDWSEAKSYCENYRGGGYTDWRMPTQDELSVLYDSDNPKHQVCHPSQNIHLTNLIYLSCCCPWASDTRGSEAAGFNFSYGNRYWLPQSNGSYHALPVRSAK